MPEENSDNAQDQNAGSDRIDDQAGNDQSNSGYPSDLGDAGKRAIDRMKAERDEAVKARRELEQKFTDAENAAKSTDNTSRNGDKQENDTKRPDQIRDEVSAQLRDENNSRVLRSEVRRLAQGKLSDATDALLFLDVSDMKPDAHGDFDSAAITAKLDELLKTRPYLAKQDKKFEGSADQGSRGDSTGKQVTRDQLKTMSMEEINKARTEGRLKDLLSGS